MDARKLSERTIVQVLADSGPVSGTYIAARLGVSRQAVHRHLQRLVAEGRVEKVGETRGATYRLREEQAAPAARTVSRTYLLAGLEEDAVFRDLSLRLNLERGLSTQAFQAVRYAFTEMLNNAIDHSRSRKASVSMSLSSLECGFSIRDFGIGLFHSIASKYELPDEMSAAGELLKGKRTTMPERHSGEGIFFTSKTGDSVVFRSHKIRLIFDNRRKDVILEETRFFRGTEVTFRIRKMSRRKLGDIFRTYSPEEYDFRFEKTRVMVKLFQRDYTSRSEARRLLAGLENFREVVLDFRDVRSIGQGFADEVFRVFKARHPQVRIEVENLRPVLAEMVRHVVDNKI